MQRCLASWAALSFATGAVVTSVALAAPNNNQAKPNPTEVAAGKKAYEAAGCQVCHKIADKGGVVGPELSKVGKTRKADWLTKKIKDPKMDNKSSLMPPYPGSAKDLKAMVVYLTTLK